MTSARRSNPVDHHRLAVECAKLDVTFEKALAEEALGQWLEVWAEPGMGQSRVGRHPLPLCQAHEVPEGDAGGDG